MSEDSSFDDTMRIARNFANALEAIGIPGPHISGPSVEFPDGRMSGALVTMIVTHTWSAGGKEATREEIATEVNQMGMESNETGLH